jgi:hypothetical protein
MKNMQSPSPGGSSDYDDQLTQRADARRYTASSNATQGMLDYLMGAGFMWEEAVTLLHLREHLYENTEMRQRMESDYRMHFVRWLCEHGEMSDD